MRILALVSTCLTVACAHTGVAWQQQVCNPEGAYQLGYNEAAEGKRMDSLQLTNGCGTNTDPVLATRYREGYEKAQATGATAKEESSFMSKFNKEVKGTHEVVKSSRDVAKETSGLVGDAKKIPTGTP